MTKTTKQIAESVVKFAHINYEHGGWDYIAECWDAQAIEDELIRSKIYTEDEAIRAFRELGFIWDQRRKDAEAEIF